MSTTAELIRREIEKGGERIWRISDFRGQPGAAVAQTLSRLAKAGVLQRSGKGIYFRPRATAFGPSMPSSPQKLATLKERVAVFPAGASAGSLLGLSTQMPGRLVVSTTRQSIPRQLIGADAIVHTRRPEKWETLREAEAAFLELLRDRAKSSELSPEATIARCVEFLKAPPSLKRLKEVVKDEPPRVRAMFGALCVEAGVSSRQLHRLRQSLNPLSRFDFGMFDILPAAAEWQAKRRRPH